MGKGRRPIGEDEISPEKEAEENITSMYNGGNSYRKSVGQDAFIPTYKQSCIIYRRCLIISTIVMTLFAILGCIFVLYFYGIHYKDNNRYNKEITTTMPPITLKTKYPKPTTTIITNTQQPSGMMPSSSTITESESPTTAISTKNYCSICGNGKEVTNPNGIFSFPAQPSISCKELDIAGKEGTNDKDILFLDDQCDFLSSLISGVCSCQPIPSPSTSPSSFPSNTPSILPSSFPSGIPTNIPSTSIPSTTPSTLPSFPFPSTLPTNTPSTPVPSNIASFLPTTSFFPSIKPTSFPSHLPSSLPSNSPTTIPSYVPSNLSSPVARSDLRCGTDENDSRINCGKVCESNIDCFDKIGEYCWKTFPNTCYTDDLEKTEGEIII